MNELLDEIENDLTPEIRANVTENVRARARAAVNRSLTTSTPARRFYEQYQEADDDARRVLFNDWKLRFLNRASGDPGADKTRRRFMQYLSLGANSRSTRAREAARQNLVGGAGGIGKIQYLLGKGADVNMPEYLWVVVYVTRINPISQRCIDFAENDPKAALMVPMVYVGHRRDTQAKRDSVRISDATRRGQSDNGLTQITRHLLDAGFKHRDDFVFDEIWNLEVLGFVDHGVGLEASNAADASVIEDIKRLDVIQEFLEGDGPRPLNSKIDNALLGVTNIRGLLREHETPRGALDIPRIERKLRKARDKLDAKYRGYRRRFIKDQNGDPVLPILNTTMDGLGQVRTAQFTPAARKRILRDMVAL